MYIRQFTVVLFNVFLAFLMKQFYTNQFSCEKCQHLYFQLAYVEEENAETER